MVGYVINEVVSGAELQTIGASAVASGIEVRAWPADSSVLPVDVSVAILIIRQGSTNLEEDRAIALVSAGIRIVCVYLEKLPQISPLAEKYCSAVAAIEGGGLSVALGGGDQIQQKSDGSPADRNRQKPHRC